MATTLGFHIILACLGIALPATVLLAEFTGLRRGDETAMRLARRWSHAMGVRIAVGAVTGTVRPFRVLRASQTQGTGPVSPGTPTSPAGDHPDSVANHRLGRPAAAGPPLRVSPPSPAAETADPRTGRPAPRRRARWSANRRTPAYAGPQRRTAKPAAAGQSVSPSELPRLPGPDHRVQAGGSELGGPFVEEIRNCVGHGHVRQA